MAKDSISALRREMEEKFFLERDKELLQALREQTERKRRKQALADASGITDDELLDQLDEMDIGSETLAALSLIPLIAVAWADGSIDAKERQAVLTAAEQRGLEAGHPGHDLLKGWLDTKPDRKLLDVWKDYVGALCHALDEEAATALKEDLLGRARAVAEAAGGLLGLLNKVSNSEQNMLDELQRAFG